MSSYLRVELGGAELVATLVDNESKIELLHAVILAVKKTKIFILLMINKSNKVRIRFSKY